METSLESINQTLVAQVSDNTSLMVEQAGSAVERDAGAFSLAAEEVRLFGVSCLGGKLDASTTLLQVS